MSRDVASSFATSRKKTSHFPPGLVSPNPGQQPPGFLLLVSHDVVDILPLSSLEDDALDISWKVTPTDEGPPRTCAELPSSPDPHCHGAPKTQTYLPASSACLGNSFTTASTPSTLSNTLALTKKHQPVREVRGVPYPRCRTIATPRSLCKHCTEIWGATASLRRLGAQAWGLIQRCVDNAQGTGMRETEEGMELNASDECHTK